MRPPVPTAQEIADQHLEHIQEAKKAADKLAIAEETVREHEEELLQLLIKINELDKDDDLWKIIDRFNRLREFRNMREIGSFNIRIQNKLQELWRKSY